MERLLGNDFLVVPVLLVSLERFRDTKSAWNCLQPEGGDGKLDVARANIIIAFPSSNAAWEKCLEREDYVAIG